MTLRRKRSTGTIIVLSVLVVIIIALVILILIRTGVISTGGSSDAGSGPSETEVALVIPTPAPGAPSLTASTDVNIRSGPDTEFEVIGVLQEDQSAQVIGVSSDRLWWAINIPSLESNMGWVADEFVTTENTDNVPVIDITVTPSAPPSPTSGVPTVTATIDTPIQAGPSSDFEAIDILLAGQTAEVTGISKDGLWWQILVPEGAGAKGWVSNEDVIAENTQNVPIVDPDTTPTPETTREPGTGATVTANTNVNIRNGPGIQYEVIGLLDEGETADVLGISVDSSWWCIVENNVPAGKGWVSGDYVTAENTDGVPVADADCNPTSGQIPIPTPAPGTPSLTANVNVNIRSGPGINFDILGLLLQGQSAQVVGKTADEAWWAIKVPSADNGRGWVSSDYVTTENTEDVPVIEG